MTELLVLEIDALPANGWDGPCVDPVAAQLTVLTSVDLATPGRLTWHCWSPQHWSVRIDTSDRYIDGISLTAQMLVEAWKDARDHPLGWTITAVFASGSSLSVIADDQLELHLAKPLPEIAERLTAVWLWPRRPATTTSVHSLPSGRGAMVVSASSPPGRSPIALLLTDNRDEGIQLWQAGRLHATATTGHCAEAVANLRKRPEWHEREIDIAAMLLLDTSSDRTAKLSAKLSARLDRNSIVAATGGMGDILGDLFEANLQPAKRQPPETSSRSSPAIYEENEELEITCADFPPNGEVCAEIARQLASHGIQCTKRMLPWADYLECLRRNDWQALYVLAPLPWAGATALPEMLSREFGTSAGSSVDPTVAIPLFTLRAGTLLKDQLTDATIDRWGAVCPPATYGCEA